MRLPMSLTLLGPLVVAFSEEEIMAKTDYSKYAKLGLFELKDGTDPAGFKQS